MEAPRVAIWLVSSAMAASSAGVASLLIVSFFFLSNRKL